MFENLTFNQQNETVLVQSEIGLFLYYTKNETKDLR